MIIYTNDGEDFTQKRGESDYDFGYRFGFDDQNLDHHQLKHYSPEFRKGYKAGKDMIDGLVDDAAQERRFG